ncbi:MAG: O-antigen ligase family protein [Chloroflexi bacterium]|nr:O-antigen ligase family protein [Chloroflexota bacterium]
MEMSTVAPAKRDSWLRRTGKAILDHPPLIEVGYLLLLLPLWWLLGIEQFIWPVGLAVIWGKSWLAGHRRISLPRTGQWLLVFLALQLLSGLSAGLPPHLWDNLLRNWGAYAGALLLVVLLANHARKWQDIQMILNALIITMAVASFCGLLAIAGVWRPRFPSLLGGLLPETLLQTPLGSLVTWRELGATARLWIRDTGVRALSFRYFRVRSFFCYAIHYASALAFSLPVLLFSCGQVQEARRRTLLQVAIVFLFLNLVATVGRMAIFASVAGAICYGLFLWERRESLRRLALPLCAVLVLIVLVVLLLGQGTAVMGAGRRLFQVVLSLRSAEGREVSYLESWRQFLQRPILGWGTVREAAGLSLPPGSHSTYLAILYRHGILGFLAFAATLWSLWVETAPVRAEPDERRTASPPARLLRYGRWVFVVALFDGLTTVVSTDATVLTILWLIFATLIAARQLLDRVPTAALYPGEGERLFPYRLPSLPSLPRLSARRAITVVVLLALLAALFCGRTALSLAVGRTGADMVDRALSADPVDIDARAASSAERWLQLALQVDGGNTQARISLGWVRFAQGRLEEASAAWRAAGLSGTDALARAQQAYRDSAPKEALRWYQQAELLDADLTSSALYGQFLALRAVRDERTFDYLQQATSVDDGWVGETDRQRAWQDWGFWLRIENRWTEAEQALSQALALCLSGETASCSSVYRELGWSQYNLGRLEEAVRNLEIAVQLRGDNPLARFRYGQVLYAYDPKRVAEVDVQFAEALRLQPDNAGIWRAIITFWLKHQENERAQHLCVQARQSGVISALEEVCPSP